MKEKLVPVTLNSPEPTGPRWRHCNQVPHAEASNAMLTKYAVSAAGNLRMPARMSGGVMVPMTIADTCCKATSNEAAKGGRSSRP